MNILKLDDIGLMFELDGNTVHITGAKSKDLTFKSSGSALLWFAHLLTVAEAVNEFTI